MKRLLIATNNNGKLIEFQELLTGLPCELVTPAQIGLDLDVIQDGLTHAENAAKKALAFAQASGLISLADDSGLEVDALGGAPGLYSARYGSNDGKNSPMPPAANICWLNSKTTPARGRRTSPPPSPLPNLMPPIP